MKRSSDSVPEQQTCEPSEHQPGATRERADDGSGCTANAVPPSPPAEARESRGAISRSVLRREAAQRGEPPPDLTGYRVPLPGISVASNTFASSTPVARSSEVPPEQCYACVACSAPRPTYGMCSQCSNAWGVGRREALQAAYAVAGTNGASAAVTDAILAIAKRDSPVEPVVRTGHPSPGTKVRHKNTGQIAIVTSVEHRLGVELADPAEAAASAWYGRVWSARDVEVVDMTMPGEASPTGPPGYRPVRGQRSDSAKGGEP